MPGDCCNPYLQNCLRVEGIVDDLCITLSQLFWPAVRPQDGDREHSLPYAGSSSGHICISCCLSLLRRCCSITFATATLRVRNFYPGRTEVWMFAFVYFVLRGWIGAVLVSGQKMSTFQATSSSWGFRAPNITKVDLSSSSGFTMLRSLSWLCQCDLFSEHFWTMLTWLSWVFSFHLFPISMVSPFVRIGFTVCRGSRYLWHPSHLSEWSVASIAWCERDHFRSVWTFAWNPRNNIPISRQDIPATNGLVHTIGQVSWLFGRGLGTSWNHVLDTFVSSWLLLLSFEGG